MNLEKLIVVGGLSGIFRVVANRKNGLIIEDLDTGKKRLATARKHQFTPLESITIYTQDENDTIELSEVFKKMYAQLEDVPLVEYKASPGEMRAYFDKVFPEYDPDRVFIGDMKKIVKWFKFLNDRELISLEGDEVNEVNEVNEVTSGESEKDEQL